MNPKTVVIDNPVPGGARVTSRRSAEKYISKGRARWVCRNRIRFMSADHRNQSAYRESVCQTDRGYDQRGVLTLREIVNLPCVKPVSLITIPSKSRHEARRNGAVKILVRNGASVCEAA